MSAASSEPRITPNQTLIGLSLALMIMTAWLAVHVYGVYWHRWTAWSLLIAPVLIALQTWLSVGLFIVAHDAMHGSLAPGRPRLNAATGTVALALYAGFRFGRLNIAHHAHHAAPGTERDPDFHAAAPRRFLPWFHGFFRTYFGWREMAVLTFAGRDRPFRSGRRRTKPSGVLGRPGASVGAAAVHLRHLAASSPDGRSLRGPPQCAQQLLRPPALAADLLSLRPPSRTSPDAVEALVEAVPDQPAERAPVTAIKPRGVKGRATWACSESLRRPGRRGACR